MMATIIAGIAEFERELIRERIRSGIAAAKTRGKRLGRQPGHRPKSDRLAPKVLALVAAGRSYRLIGREVGLRIFAFERFAPFQSFAPSRRVLPF
jgi:putative DNA-invertase from lambdoid prophage Rac